MITWYHVRRAQHLEVEMARAFARGEPTDAIWAQVVELAGEVGLPSPGGMAAAPACPRGWAGLPKGALPGSGACLFCASHPEGIPRRGAGDRITQE
jgi:hypothetical protein